MTTRNISLTDHYDGFIEERLKSGRYKNASEIVRAGLQALEQREAEDALRLDALRAELKAGIVDIENGNFDELSSADDVSKLLDDIEVNAEQHKSIR